MQCIKFAPKSLIFNYLCRGHLNNSYRIIEYYKEYTKQKKKHKKFSLGIFHYRGQASCSRACLCVWFAIYIREQSQHLAHSLDVRCGARSYGAAPNKNVKECERKWIRNEWKMNKSATYRIKKSKQTLNFRPNVEGSSCVRCGFLPKIPANFLEMHDDMQVFGNFQEKHLNWCLALHFCTQKWPPFPKDMTTKALYGSKSANGLAVARFLVAGGTSIRPWNPTWLTARFCWFHHFAPSGEDFLYLI